MGEFGRKLGTRLTEHKSSAASSKSAVKEHVVRSRGHEIDWTGVKVLERESKELSRRVLGAIQIKTKKGWGQMMDSSFHDVICHHLTSSST